MPNRQTYESYTVQKGDTLAAIAKRFGASVADIALASAVVDPNKISVGQVLSIPVTAEDDLSEVVVNARAVPLTPSPLGDPVVSLVMGAGEWLKPPKLWVTLAVALGVGYYLIDSDRPRRRRR